VLAHNATCAQPKKVLASLKLIYIDEVFGENCQKQQITSPVVVATVLAPATLGEL
jgi:hypothetical protein